MKILITGATGLIGSRIMEYLLNRGDLITGISNSGNLENFSDKFRLTDIILLKCNLCELPNLNEILPDAFFDVVIHCASQQPRKTLSYQKYHQGNVQILDNLLTWMRNRSIKNIIYLSTVVFLDFTENEMCLLNENCPVFPSNYYSLTKYAAERLLDIRSTTEGFNTVCLRLPSVILKEQKGGIVQTFYSHAIGNKDIELYSHGKYKRNIIHIDDIIQGVVKSLDKLNKFKHFNLFTLGSKDSLPLKTIAEYIYRKTNSTGAILPVNTPTHPKGHWAFDLTAAKQALNFIPATIYEGLDKYFLSMRTS